MTRLRTPLLAVFSVALAHCGGSGEQTARDGGLAEPTVSEAGPGDAARDTGRSDGGGTTDGGLDAARQDAATDAGDAGDAGDTGDALFRPDHVLEVRITLPPADWEALRNQRPVPGAPRADCSGSAAAEAYTYFRADVSIDGLSFRDVAVRKKGGLGSIDSARPGLKLDLHEYVPDQDIDGLEHLTLNNNHQDPSLVHQCLGYGLFAAAGLPAPRCSFAHVLVNGEDLGIYSNVETLKREFVRRHFADPSGDLFESGGDFDRARVAGFQPKADKQPPDCSALTAVATALEAPDERVESALEAVLDLPAFIRHWAMEVLVDHWDGYANNQNNYYLYAEPASGRVTFIPWGLDSLFEGRKRTTRPASVFACGALAFRLYDVPATRARYLATLRELIATVWDPPALRSELDRMEALITPFVPSGASGTPTLRAEIDKVRQFVATRAATLLQELDAGEPVWPYPADESCRIKVGSLTASFNAPWDSLARFDVGSGTMSGTVAGVSVAGGLFMRAAAGIGDDGKPSVRLVNPIADGRYAAVYVVFQDLAALTPGTRAFDLASLAAAMAFYDPATQTSSAANLLYPGSLTLDSVRSTPGGAIVGSLSGDILEL